MIKKVILFLTICMGTVLCSAQDVTIWKHILRFSNDRYLPKGYVSSKYYYHDTTLLYKMDYSDNGWQVYDSVSYKKNDGLWCISHFDSDTNSQLYLRFSDTVKNLYYQNNDIHYFVDKYNVLSRYLNGINELISRCKTDSLIYVLNYMGDTCCYLFVDVDYPLLFTDYGVPPNESLDKYCCHVGKHGEYEWDKFFFSEYTIIRHFDYDNIGNIFRVTVIKTNEILKKKTTWIESFFITNIDHMLGTYISK